MIVLTARQLAFQTLRAIQSGAYADVALDRTLQKAAQKPAQTANPAAKPTATEPLSANDRRLLTELVYGCVRRQRTLDALIDHFANKPAAQQPPDLRLILHLGLYQLRYLSHIPAAAAVDTSVTLAKTNHLTGLSGLVNAILRQYLRQQAHGDPLAESSLGIRHSYPDWILDLWAAQLPAADLEPLADWFNRPPSIDLRINPLRTSLTQVETALHAVGLHGDRLPHLPQALRLRGAIGPVQNLPGFDDGWWMVQDASAQQVVHLLDPQPGETIIDACAAPGGKTLHIAELMGDRGCLWACDRTPSRLRKLQANASRLGITSLQIRTGDSTHQPDFVNQADRVLVDAPCSGLGTLHRHADARWRQTPAQISELAHLQAQLLSHTATWVKPGGTLVYATCTLHPQENEQVIQGFLATHPTWAIAPPAADTLGLTSEGWLKVWPHRSERDGFFMVRLIRAG